MGTVAVYKVQMYDSLSDSVKLSRRMATVEGAKAMGGWIVGPAVSIDDQDLESGWKWTPLDNEPRKVALPQRASLLKAAPFVASGGAAGMFDQTRVDAGRARETNRLSLDAFAKPSGFISGRFDQETA